MSEQRLTDTAFESRPDGELLQPDVHTVTDGLVDDDHPHFALLYESRDELFATAIPFLREGLEQGERCWYIVDDTTEAAVVEALSAGGIDVEAARASGDLAIYSKEGTYFEDGEFDPETMIATWTERACEVIDQGGYEGLRIAGEATWELTPDGDDLIDGARDYESQLNDLFAREDCLGLCMYNRERFPSATLEAVIKHHPQVIYEETLAPNVYYTPPAEATAENSSLHTVERQLQTLVDRTQARTELEAARHKLEVAATAGSIGVWTIDVQENIATADEQLAAYTGIDPAKAAAGVPPEEFVAALTETDQAALLDTISSAIEETGAFEHEVQSRTADGERAWLAITGEVEDAAGESMQLYGTVSDITERKQREQQLARQRDQIEQLKDRLLDTSPTGVLLFDAAGEITLADDRAAEILDRPSETLVGRSYDAPVFDLVDPMGEPIPTEELPVEQVWHRGDAVFDMEVGVTQPDGQRIWLSVNGAPLYNEDTDGVSETILTLEDITERKRREQLLSEQTELLERIATGVPLEECLSALCSSVSRLNPGVRASILLADAEREAFHSSIAPNLEPSWGEGLEDASINELMIGTCDEAVCNGTPVTCENVTTDDRWADEWREVCVANGVMAGHSEPIQDEDGDRLGSFMLCFDEPKAPNNWDQQLADFGTHIASIAIERDRSRRALRDSEERLRLATDAGELGIWEIDSQSDAPAVRSPRHDEIFGYEEPVEDWTFEGDSLDHVHPDDRERIEAGFEKALETGDWETECRIIRADGEQRWIAAQAEVYDDNGEAARVIGTVEDITERKERERKLSEQSELEEYGAFVRAVEDYAIFMLDPDGAVTSWNDGAERIKGYTADDIVGEHFSAFYTDADIDEGVPAANLETAAAEGRVEDESWRVRKDGSRFWADVVITAIRDDDGTLQGFTKVTRDRTEQREYERQLRQERDLTEQILDTVPVGICSITSDGDFVRANQRALTYIGCEESDFADYSVDSWDLYDAEGEPIPTDEWPWTRVTETGESVYNYQCQVDLPDIGRRWFSLNAAPLYDDQSDDQSGEASKTVVALEDITDRKQTTDALAYLNDTTRDLMEAEPQAINERAADLTQVVLDVASTSLWRYDEATGDLQLHTASTASGIDPEAIRYPDDFEERAWRTFISTEMDTSNDFPPASESGASETPIRSGVMLPLGRHGVLCAGSIRPDAFDETTVDLAGTVAATIETALDRAADEQQLARHNEELTRLNQTNDIIRNIDQALVQAETREEINRVVCDQLAQSERYHCAWIGEYDLATETITPQEWAGIDASDVEALTDTPDNPPFDQGPVGTAAHTNEVQVIEDIVTDVRFAPWREQTLAIGARACLAIPLVYNEALYGVLTVYTSSPQIAPADHTVLGELGETITHAINAVETKETLHTDSVVELELHFQDPDAPLCRLAQQADCRIDVEGIRPQANGSTEVFVTAPAALQTAGETSIAIEELTCLAECDDESQFKAAVTAPSLPSRLVEQDAKVRTLTIEGESATAVVDLPSTVAVRDFIESIQTKYPSTDLRRRRTRDRPLDTATTFPSTVNERLTDRQQEILQTAYRSGFFQSPREHTGKEIAALLDISPPTFTQHLRAGQHNLCEGLFDDA